MTAPPTTPSRSGSAQAQRASKRRPAPLPSVLLCLSGGPPPLRASGAAAAAGPAIAARVPPEPAGAGPGRLQGRLQGRPFACGRGRRTATEAGKP